MFVLSVFSSFQFFHCILVFPLAVSVLNIVVPCTAVMLCKCNTDAVATRYKLFAGDGRVTKVTSYLRTRKKKVLWSMKLDLHLVDDLNTVLSQLLS